MELKIWQTHIRYGGGAKSNLSKKESLLFRNINEFNKYLLLTVGVLIISLSGTISYYVNTSYASWNSVSYSEESFEFSVSVPTHLEISTPPSKLTYGLGEVFDKTDMVVKEVYTSGRKVIIEDYEVSPSGKITEDDTSITISYNGLSTTQNINLYLPNLDNSGANEPQLLSNMLPVFYDASCNNDVGCWKKADNTNGSPRNKWYDYDEKMWANAVTVSSTNRQTYINAPKGTEIKMEDINTMWVWIPRYTYTYFASNTPTEIQIEFEQGTASGGSIICTDNVSGSGATSQTCTDKNTNSLVVGTSTYTHPAFTFGDTPLEGIWVGKFENSATTILTANSTAESEIIIKPDVQSLRYKAISYFFKDIRQMEKYNNIYGFEQKNNTTFNFTGELTGDSNNLDTHMLKNIEWGAVAYLSHSKYGKNGEINVNNSSPSSEDEQIGFYTGRSGGNVGDKVLSGRDFYGSNVTTSNLSSCTYGYYTYDGYLLNYDSNVKSTTRNVITIASTTGNIYGVYDMAGGAWDYVMSNMVNISNQFYVSSGGNWSSILPLTKYYDSYTYNTSDVTFTRGRLGDATTEVVLKAEVVNYRNSWYEDYGAFVYDNNVYFRRGSMANFGPANGLFAFNRSTGGANPRHSSRSTLVLFD